MASTPSAHTLSGSTCHLGTQRRTRTTSQVVRRCSVLRRRAWRRVANPRKSRVRCPALRARAAEVFLKWTLSVCRRRSRTRPNSHPSSPKGRTNRGARDPRFGTCQDNLYTNRGPTSFEPLMPPGSTTSPCHSARRNVLKSNALCSRPSSSRADPSGECITDAEESR